VKKARQGSISQGLLKCSDGDTSQQHLAAEVLVPGSSRQSALSIVGIRSDRIASGAIRSGAGCCDDGSRHHLFGNGLGFPFVSIVRSADRKFGLQNCWRDEALSRAVTEGALQER
jgi:hypothetical protein